MPRAAKTPPPAPAPVRRWPRSAALAAEIIAGIVLVAVASSLLFGGLGASSFHDGDEALYATVAREMVQNRSFLTPTYWDAPFLHKPPLPYWLMALSASLLPGSREFDARFPSALSALLLLALVYATARRLAGAAPAVLATGMLAFNHQFLFEHAARSASFDSLLALLMFAALVAGLRAGDGFRWSAAAAGLLGSIALVKAPMVIFPLGVVVVHHLLRDRRLAARFVVTALVGMGVVALPWHAYQLAARGREFWDTYVIYEIIGRTGDTVRDVPATSMIHLHAAWASFLPWSPLLLAALAGVLAGRSRRAGDEPGGSARAIAAYAAFILLFFCFIPSKWPWYGVPAYPAAAVTGAVFARRWYESRHRRLLPAALALTAIGSVLLLRTNPEYEPASRAAFMWPAHGAFYEWGRPGADPVAWAWAALMIAAGIAPLSSRTGKRVWVGVAALALAGALPLGVTLQSVRGVPQNYRSADSRLSEEIEAAGIERVYASGFRHISYYDGRQEPLSSFYLLGIRGARVTDCGATLDCVSSPPAERAALVVWEAGLGADARAGLSERAASLAPGVETWVVRSTSRYERLR